MSERDVSVPEISLAAANKKDVPALKVELVRSFGKFCVGKFGLDESFNDYHKGKIMDEHGTVECDYGGFFLFEKETKVF